MTIGDELDRRSRRGAPRGPDQVWSAAVEAARRRRRIPVWAMPVLVLVPLWAVIYVAGLSGSSSGGPTQLEQGAAIFSARCAQCHGTRGEGGAGRPMADGALLDTFPDLVGQLEFVWTGSEGVGPAGSPYGDPARPGGQHVTFEYRGAGMPPFGGSLSQAELLAVVRYEREVLSGAEPAPEQVGPDGELWWPDGNPMLDPAGQIVLPDGRALFDADGTATVAPDWRSPLGGSS